MFAKRGVPATPFGHYFGHYFAICHTFMANGHESMANGQSNGQSNGQPGVLRRRFLRWKRAEMLSAHAAVPGRPEADGLEQAPAGPGRGPTFIVRRGRREPGALGHYLMAKRCRHGLGPTPPHLSPSLGQTRAGSAQAGPSPLSVLKKERPPNLKTDLHNPNLTTLGGGPPHAQGLQTLPMCRPSLWAPF